MKTQRRRNRAGVARTPERVQENNGSNGINDSNAGNPSNGSDQVVDGELSDVEQIGDVDLENGVEAHLEENGAEEAPSELSEAVAPGNGKTDETASRTTAGHGSAAGKGNGKE